MTQNLPAEYDPNMVYQYNEPPAQPTASTGGKHYFRVSSIDVFTYYNPRGAQVVLSTNLYTTDLYLAITPAIPNNPAVNIRGPVPAGTQVYNYEKKIVAALAFHELVEIKKYLRKHIFGEQTTHNESKAAATVPVSDVLGMLTNISSLLAQNNSAGIASFVSEWNAYLASQNMASTQHSTPAPAPTQFANASGTTPTPVGGSMGTPTANDQGVVLWRKGTINKRISINFDQNRQMFFFSATINNDNSNRAYTGMKLDYAEQFLTVVESYLTNYTLHKIVGGLCNSIDMLTGFKKN